jgi:hypothetical protein
MNIQVLTTDTVPAHQLADYIAQDWHATPGLRAGWSVAFGPVTEVLFLQSLGAGSAPPSAPSVHDGIVLEGRRRQWLQEVKPHQPATEAITHYELRTYDARIGAGAHFLELMLGALPIRERHSRNFGIWTSLSGRHEQILHLWGYRGLRERDTVRANLKLDPEWQSYVATILPMLQVLHSTILIPMARC